MNEENINKDNFIESLALPDGVQPKHFEGMNRYHFKYYGEGFLVLDLHNEFYNLRTREQYFRGVKVFDFEKDKHHGPNSAAIMHISYNDTDIFYRLINYITHDKVYSPNEASDINVPMKPKNRIRKPDGTIRYICGRCDASFSKSPRCPECGQLVNE